MSTHDRQVRDDFYMLAQAQDLASRQRAQMVALAMRAGCAAPRLAEEMGVTRARVHQLRDWGEEMLERRVEDESMEK